MIKIFFYQLFNENVPPNHIAKIITNHIDLNTLHKEPTNKLAIGHEDGFSCKLPYIMQFYHPYPYEGIQLVRTCLHSPFRNVRNAGMTVLNSWKETMPLDWNSMSEIKDQINYLLTLPLDDEDLSNLGEIFKD